MLLGIWICLCKCTQLLIIIKYNVNDVSLILLLVSICYNLLLENKCTQLLIIVIVTLSLLMYYNLLREI